MSYVLLGETTPVARKQYRCIWCGEHILIGEKYCRERSVYDGEPQSHKWHMECRDGSSTYFHETGEEEFCPHENERPALATPSTDANAGEGVTR